MPALLKLLLLFIVSGMAFLSYYSSAAAILTIGAGAIIAKIPLRTLFRGIRSVLIVCIPVLLFRSLRFMPFRFLAAGFVEALLFTAGVIIVFCAGSLTFSVTTTAQMRDALSFGQRSSAFAAAFSLMIGFIRRFFMVWDEVDCAYRARAGKEGFHKMIIIIPLVIERMIRAAAETAYALEARGGL
jgi:energy-coupling factor transporter transmembrane protein EcfT